MTRGSTDPSSLLSAVVLSAFTLKFSCFWQRSIQLQNYSPEPACVERWDRRFTKRFIKLLFCSLISAVTSSDNRMRIKCWFVHQYHLLTCHLTAWSHQKININTALWQLQYIDILNEWSQSFTVTQRLTRFTSLLRKSSVSLVHTEMQVWCFLRLFSGVENVVLLWLEDQNEEKKCSFI